MSDDTLDTAGAVSAYLGGTGFDPSVPVRQSVAGAIDTNADLEAKLQQAARRTGVSLLAAREAPDEVHRQARLQAIDFGDMVQRFPQTAAFLVNQDKARIAHDDVPVLQSIEHAIKYLVSAPDSSSTLMGDLAGAYHGGSSGIAGAFAGITNTAAYLTDPLEQFPSIGGNPLRRLGEGWSMIADDEARRQKAAAGVSATWFGNAFSSGVQSFGQNAMVMPMALLPGGQAATLTAMSAMAGGQSYQKDTEKGIGHWTALGHGASDAAIEYGTELLPMHKLIGDVKAGTPLWKTLVHNAALEVPGEQVATALQDLNDWAVNNEGKTFGDYLKARPEAAAQTLIATLVGVGGNVTLTHAVQGAADRATGRERIAEQADLRAQAITQLTQLAEASKLRERDPGSFAEFAQSLADNSVPALYVDANALQQSGVDMAELARAMPSVAQQADALATGGDLVIPTGEFVAGTPGATFAQSLIDHARTAPDAMSAAEAKVYMQEHGDQLQAEIARVLGERQQDDAFQASRDQVAAQFQAQLDEAKRFTPDVNRTYASMLGSFYAVTAARMGVTPAELVKQYPLRIAAEPVTGGLEQGQRGAFDPASFTMAIMKGADLSTTIHESGHAFLEMYADLAARVRGQATEGASVADGAHAVADDMDRLLSWFGVQATPEHSALDVWHGMTLDEKRAAHEKFARGFEAYAFEGKSPSRDLQGIFQRFRAWLLSIYREMKNLNVQLDDEVRGVMDRMLATTQQIQEAEAARQMGALFQTPEQAGMTPEEFKAYHELGIEATQTAIEALQARGLRDMQWLANARGRTLKALQKQHEALRKETEREVRAEVMAQPIYQAWQFLTGRGERVKAGELEVGETPDVSSTGKLRTSAVKEANPEQLAVLAERRMVQEKDGLHPDVVAEAFGFSSGDELVRSLAEAQAPHVVIEGMTDQRMLERHGDLGTPEGLQRAADEAIHNEVRGRFIATELAALDKATNVRAKVPGTRRSVDVMARAARDMASNILSRLKLREIRPAQYAAAEVRAARAAQKALAAGDLEEAAAQKRNELIQHQAARQAQAAQAEVRSALDYLRGLQKRPKGVDAAYLDQIDALLERFDLRESTSLREVSRRKTLAAWVESMREQGLEPDVPPELLDEAFRRSFRDLTLEELRGLRDTVRQIEHLGRLKNRLLTAKAQREFEAIRDEIADSIVAHAGDRKADTRTPATTLGRALKTVRDFGAAHIKAATWARVFDGGKDGGPVWEYLVRAANERGDMETSMRADATAKLHAIIQPLFAGGKLGGKGKYIATVKRSLNREQIIAIALNTGNAGNLQRLLGGEGWTVGQIAPVLATLTAQEWATVQAVWDHFESYRPAIGAKEKRVYGKEPNWVEPEISPDLRAVVPSHVTGGYYPIKYDPLASNRAEQHNDAEAAKRQLQGAYTSATTRRGFTKERVAEVSGRPLLYSLGGVYSGVNDVVHDLAWHEWLIDANKILRSDKIDGAIREHYGPSAVRQLKTWVQDVAAGEQGLQAELDGALGRLRHGVSVAGLGFNVMSAVMQPLGITQSIVRVGARWVGVGMGQYLAAPIAKTREVNEKSAFMENRARTRFRELNELRNQVEGQHPAREMVGRYAYLLMMRCQQMVDTPTWLGAYEKAVAEGNAEDRAIALADQAVLDAQGGGQTKDLAAIERGGPAQKLFTVFYSFMNTALNAGVSQTMTADTPAKKAKLAADYLLLYVAPAVLGALLKDALVPGDSGDGDPEKLLRKLLGEQLAYLMGLMVVVREFAEAGKTVFHLGDRPRDYSGPAGVRLVADAGTLAKQVQQGEFDDQFRKAAVNLAGDLFALPAAQVNRTVTGAKALSEGKTSNPLALAFGFQEQH